MRRAGVCVLLGSFLARTALCFVAPTLGVLPQPAATASLPLRAGLLAASLVPLQHRFLASRAGALSLKAARGGGKMPNGVKKENLPTKVCVTCNRPFTWRKKWEKCWDEVTTCSKSCNAQRRKAKQLANGESGSESGEDDSARGRGAPSPTGAGRGRRGSSPRAGGASGAEAAVRTQSEEERATKKEAKKAVKAERRARRQGTGDPDTGKKSCTLCDKRVDLLIRCQTDQSKEWRMVCGPCWPSVSGGIVDGDAAHPHYRYGGLWKNRAKQQGAGSEGEEDEALAGLLEAARVC